MKYDKFELLKQYVDKGWVIKQDHPTLPLSIYNYSRGVQYEKLWDPITLECRGLVLDSDGNLIAKPFPKFFNYEEMSPASIPNQPFEVFEKMDGSLGICFFYNDEWHMATRGSFTSEQAIKGKELLTKENTKYGMIPGYTYLFEIIYPENRIVVDYGGVEKLVVLAVYNNETGIEGSIENMESEGFEVVKKYNGVTDFKTLKETISNDAEGFVIRFKRGMRMKIKGDEYVRLHRILTNFSTTDIWELLRTDGNLNEFLERVPDEFDNWVKGVVSDLQNQFDEIKFKMEIEFTELVDKKEFAEKIIDNPIKSLLFKRLNSYAPDLNDMIWKMIKPKWSKPFKKDIDN
jgi:RNA ligase